MTMPNYPYTADFALFGTLLVTRAGAVLLGAVIGWYARGRR